MVGHGETISRSAQPAEAQARSWFVSCRPTRAIHSSARFRHPRRRVGFFFEETAQVCGCAVGTIKSRVNRSRTRLAGIMSIENVNDFGPGQTTQAILARKDRH